MDFKQQILLAVTGLSPQVITETIYALHKAGKPIPSRIVIITTLRGAQEVITHLITEKKVEQLCQDYQLPPIKLLPQDILVVSDAKGNAINDATSIDDHTAMSDFISEKVRALTANPDCAIHASLAGGRKTMTFLLGYAMSLYGRKQDSLSHILVTEGFESSQFFYPTPYPQQIYLRIGSRNAMEAKVTLAEIPFVRLRDEFPDKLLSGRASYSETVDWLNIDLDKEIIILHINSRSVNFCQQNCQLPPAEFVFYWWFILRAKAELAGLSIPHEVAPEPEYANEFLAIYRKSNDYIKTENIEQTNFKLGMDKRYFEERKTKVNTSFKKLFGKRIGQYLQIKQQGKIDRRMTFGISIEPKNIIIKDYI